MRKTVASARLVISLSLFLCSGFAWCASIITVTSSADSGINTLRDALANAANGDSIAFALPADSTITLLNTLIVNKSVSIDGAGTHGLVISGNHSVSVLQVTGPIAATLTNLTIAYGSTGIINQATLTVSKCTILGNTNIGIANNGPLTVVNSTFSGNAALSLGGGIKLTSGVATITNNTFVNNNAQYGGGIESNSNSISTIVNNLFEGNFVTEKGGSIYDAIGKVNADHNLYWNNPDTNGSEDCFGCANNSDAIFADPLVDSLANNGGPTQTYLPGVGGAAIDSGDDVTCAASPTGNLDQREFVRPIGLHCDVGSVEVNDPIFANGLEPPPAYSTSFETCPSDWTLSGDWQCGVPQNVGPVTAFDGTQCLGTQIAGLYSDNQTWLGTTANSPAIDLTGRPNPKLTFRMWIDTEGSTYDGANLMISADGGATYSLVNGVTPAYTLIVDHYPAWGGHQALLGWQAVTADLSPYSGQVVRLQFAFRSDASGEWPGFYVDSVLVQ